MSQFINFWQSVFQQDAFSPYDYPLTYNVSEDVYFGILATSTDGDLELFTESCVSRPDRDPGLDQYHEIITSGFVKMFVCQQQIFLHL